MPFYRTQKNTYTSTHRASGDAHLLRLLLTPLMINTHSIAKEPTSLLLGVVRWWAMKVCTWFARGPAGIVIIQNFTTRERRKRRRTQKATTASWSVSCLSAPPHPILLQLLFAQFVFQTVYFRHKLMQHLGLRRWPASVRPCARPGAHHLQL